MEDFLNYLNVRQIIFSTRGADPKNDEDVKDALVESYANVHHFTDEDLDEVTQFYRDYENRAPGAIYLAENLLRLFNA